MDGLSALLRFLAPRVCPVCGRTVARPLLCGRCSPARPRRGRLCPRCSADAPPDLASADRGGECAACVASPLSYRRFRWAWRYDHTTRPVVLAMKFGGAEAVAAELGRRLAGEWEFLFPGETWDLLVPVPPSSGSFRRRLFSPTHRMAAALARETGSFGRVAPSALRRLRGPPQSSLPRANRTRAAAAAFGPADRAAVAARSVLLLDDVATTGASAAAAAAALYAAGARSVDVLAAFRSENWCRHRSEVYRSFPPAPHPTPAAKPNSGDS